MNVRDIRDLYAYNQWANQRMLESVEKLTPTQFAQTLGGSFSSIRDTVAHIALAEWVWLRRWKGESPTTPPEGLSAAPLEQLREALQQTERERASFIDSLTDAALEGSLHYKDLAGNAHTRHLGDLLHHVANHSTYHRGQVATMLRQVGGTPISTDMVLFYATGR